MAGRSRTVLNKMEHLLNGFEISAHDIMKKNASNYSQSEYYHAEYKNMVKDFEKKIKTILQDHITFLLAKDPFDRVQTNDQRLISEKKIELFTKLLTDLAPLSKEEFCEKLKSSLNRLQKDTIIDRPRWPTLNFKNFYRLFQRATQPLYSKHEPTPSQENQSVSSKDKKLEKSLREPKSKHSR